MMKVGTKVMITSLELTPYVDISQEFTVISSTPYKGMNGWV